MLSKSQNISIFGPTILHLFSMDDMDESEKIDLEAFVQRLSEFLSSIKVKGQKVLLKPESISNHDLRFLGTKYMERDGEMKVKYIEFLQDYELIDK